MRKEQCNGAEAQKKTENTDSVMQTEARALSFYQYIPFASLRPCVELCFCEVF
jgi:hypothetical protein